MRWMVTIVVLAGLTLAGSGQVAGPWTFDPLAYVAATTALAQGAPNHPAPEALTLNPATTALIVLDLNERCADSAQVCSELAPRVRPLIDKARAAGVFVLYTVSENEIARGLGDPWAGFERRPEEPVLYIGAAFDKFREVEPRESELNALLQDRGIDTIIIAGSSSNMGVMYTATGAAAVYGYHVVIPYDGINSASAYQDAYAIHQFTVMASGANQLFAYTTIDQLQFGVPSAQQ
jgi:nicotinamidase-related amidase